MALLGIELQASDCNLLSGDISLGLSPVSSYQFLYALLLQSGLFDSADAAMPAGFVLGVKSFKPDTDRWGHLAFRGNAYSSFPTGAYAQQWDDKANARYDDFRAAVGVCLVVEVNASLETLVAAQKLLFDTLLTLRYLGGDIDPDTQRVLPLGTEQEALRWLQRSRILADRTPLLRRLAQQTGQPLRDVLFELAVSPVSPEIRARYGDALPAQAWFAPMAVGYRFLTPLSTTRPGRRDGLPHAYVDSLTGLGEHINPRELEPHDLPSYFWVPRFDKRFFIMEHA